MRKIFQQRRESHLKYFVRRHRRVWADEVLFGVVMAIAIALILYTSIIH